MSIHHVNKCDHEHFVCLCVAVFFFSKKGGACRCDSNPGFFLEIKICVSKFHIAYKASAATAFTTEAVGSKGVLCLDFSSPLSIHDNIHVVESKAGASYR